MKLGLSKREQALLSELARRQVRFLTPARAEEILKTSRQNAYRILSRLCRKGWLERIKQGLYLLVPFEAQEGWAEHEFVYASRFISPYYISYRTALAHWGLTEQLPQVVFIATTQRHRDLEFQGARFQFITLHPRKFFGFKEILVSGIPVHMADPEKTLVDCLDQEAYGGGILEIAQALLEGRGWLDIDKLCGYAKRMGSGVLLRRLGYLLDLLELGDTKDLLALVNRPAPAYLSLLLPREEITRNQKWRLIINVPEEELLRGREVL